MSTPFAGSTAITNQCPVRGRLCRGPRLAPPPPTMSNNAGGLLGVHAPFPACATGRDFGLPCGAAFAPPPPPRPTTQVASWTWVPRAHLRQGSRLCLPGGATFGAPLIPPSSNNAGGLQDVDTFRTPLPGLATLSPRRGHVWCPPNPPPVQQRWWPPRQGCRGVRRWRKPPPGCWARD